ncbi:MAG: glutathione S-transferase [Alphaproteobacteria bacterium PA4]|nr:MAG: glutathione S-transferase [Alphaproteobacteria bacterium PA4]
MIIYGATLSPFVRKVLVVAAEKGLAVESKPIGLGSKDPDFRAASPFGKIPALRNGDFTLCDSSAIVHYMEAVQPAPAMIPAAAEDRARTIWYDEFADTIFVAAAGKIFFNRVVAPLLMKRPGDQALADKAEAEEMPPIFAYIERMLPDSGHLVGDALTLADIAVASPFVNLAHAGVVPDAELYPRITAFVAAMLARPSFAPLVAAERRMLAGITASAASPA